MNKNIFLFLLILSDVFFCQPKESMTSSEIKIALNKLNTLGSVLYIAAHPDDENNAFLTYFNSAKNLRTGYLALTRGEGGQNLIGDEQGDLLGVIRTQELLQARSIDGAEQFFTRAVDFGYSKNADETFKKWGKDEVLSDVVWVIRKFRPDVIVTRFPVEGTATHGHHTASAILALEAFKLSGDSTAFREQLKFLKPWQPKRIFWNVWTPPSDQKYHSKDDTLIKINLGEYNSLLGRSYTEISALSRSKHKSQGFGASGRRENLLNYFSLLDGQPAKSDIFDGIDLSWNRVEGSENVSKLLKQAEVEYDFENPASILPLLTQTYKELQKLDDKFWVEIKSAELAELIKFCAGIWTEAVTEENFLTPGSEIKVTTGFVIRTDAPIKLKSVNIDYQEDDNAINSSPAKGEMISTERKILIPQDAEYSQPYWLVNGHHKNTYIVDDQKLIGIPQSDYPVYSTFTFNLFGTEINLREPVFFRKNDPVQGEVYKRIEIVPEVVVNFEKDLYLLRNGEEKEIRVFLKNIKDNQQGTLKIISEKGWKIQPTSYHFNFGNKGQEQEFKFRISSTNNNTSSLLKAEVDITGKKLNKRMITINYPHIQTQTVLFDAETKILKLEFPEKILKKIAYINGSGDKIPELLKDLGYKIDVFTKEPLTSELLQNYDVVIAGIRAYNTNQRLLTDQKNILKFIENGGIYIVQYNTLGDMFADPSPYKIKISRDRVTEEDSPVKIINEDNSVLKYPFNISEYDFNGWIQERGLYFPDEWDEKFIPILEMNDTNENPKQGSLLISKYGKGTFIYTGLSFFRQLPTGVEGAYKLFINLISAGSNE